MSHLTLEALPERSLLVFKSSTCQKCGELLDNLKQVSSSTTIIYLDETNGGILGAHFAIMMAPTSLLIESGREIDRFYGVKSPEAIEEFLQ